MTASPAPRSSSFIRSVLPWLFVLALLAAAAWWFWPVASDDQAGDQAGDQAAQQTAADKPGPLGKPGKFGKKGGRGGDQMSTVGVAEVKQQDIPQYLNAIGTVTPISNVIVKPRVDGQLIRVLFKEGQYVNKGDLLAEIDARPYQVQLTQAEGQMARDRALLKNAELDLQRYQTLLAQDSLAKQQLDTQESLVRQYQGAIQTDQGVIDNAKLQLSFTRITAPVSGRIGLRLVDAGNMVSTADATGLLTIAQIKPINVVFSLPQDDLPAVLGPLRKGERLPVSAYARDQKTLLAEGVLSSLDNQVDTTTGTVKLKGEFSNADEALFPSQFVNVRLLTSTLKQVLTVPNNAVLRGAQGDYVYVVKADRTVTVKPVQVLTIEGDITAVRGELQPGQQVVTDGADKLREGAEVALAKPVLLSDKTDKPSGRRADASSAKPARAAP